MNPLPKRLFALLRREVREILQEKGQRLWRVHVLIGFIVLRGQRGAKRIVSVHDGLKRVSERSNVQRPIEIEDERSVIERATRHEAVEKPQSTLGKRNRFAVVIVGGSHFSMLTGAAKKWSRVAGQADLSLQNGFAAVPKRPNGVVPREVGSRPAFRRVVPFLLAYRSAVSR